MDSYSDSEEETVNTEDTESTEEISHDNPSEEELVGRLAIMRQNNNMQYAVNNEFFTVCDYVINEVTNMLMIIYSSEDSQTYISNRNTWKNFDHSKITMKMYEYLGRARMLFLTGCKYGQYFLVDIIPSVDTGYPIFIYRIIHHDRVAWACTWSSWLAKIPTR